MNNSVFGRIMEDVTKQRYQACNKWKKKGFNWYQSIVQPNYKAKVLYNKTVYWNFFSGRNKKSSHE